jgi:hypothetical protein
MRPNILLIYLCLVAYEALALPTPQPTPYPLPIRGLGWLKRLAKKIWSPRVAKAEKKPAVTQLEQIPIKPRPNPAQLAALKPLLAERDGAIKSLARLENRDPAYLKAYAARIEASEAEMARIGQKPIKEVKKETNAKIREMMIPVTPGPPKYDAELEEAMKLPEFWQRSLYLDKREDDAHRALQGIFGIEGGVPKNDIKKAGEIIQREEETYARIVNQNIAKQRGLTNLNLRGLLLDQGVEQYKIFYKPNRSKEGPWTRYN